MDARPPIKERMLRALLRKEGLLPRAVRASNAPEPEYVVRHTDPNRKQRRARNAS